MVRILEVAADTGTAVLVYDLVAVRRNFAFEECLHHGVYIYNPVVCDIRRKDRKGISVIAREILQDEITAL